MADREVCRIHECYQGVDIDKYVVMPNHIHMIVMLHNADDNHGRPQIAPTLSRIVQQFKGAVTKQAGFSLWQKSFHDRVIRSEAEYRDIWQYIDTNALKWALDKYHTD